MIDPSHTCHIGFCQRHRRCMYTPCRSAVPERCPECNAEAPAHYGSCSKLSPELRAMCANLEQEQRERSAPVVVVQPARQQGKTLALARERVRRVAEGGTINLTYRMSPEPALDAFRADLLLILGP